MSVSPDGGRAYAKVLADLYGDAAQQLIDLVARRLARGITDPGWAEVKLSQILALRQETATLVRALERDAYQIVAEQMIEAYQAGILSAGGPGATADGAGLVATNRAAVEALAADTARTLAATHTRILRTSEDVYRRVIAETAGQVVVGAQSRREAAARAVARFAQQGVTGFVDAKGRNWELASYAEMATRTAAGQAHIQGGLDRYEQQGRYLVIVSDAPEECSLCRPFEGRVLSITGREPPPTDIEGHRYGGTLATARAAGFLHPSCRHALSPFVPGLTRPRTAPTADPEGDRLRQRQRALERAVRESKRRVAGVQPFGDTVELGRERALLARRREALRSFVADNDRKSYVSKARVSLTSR